MARRFGAVTDQVTAGVSSFLSGPSLSSCTVAFWWNGDTTPGTASTTMILFIQGTGNNGLLFPWDRSTAPHAFRVDNQAATVSVGSVVGLTWYHIVLTWDGALYQTYLNGVAGPSLSRATFAWNSVQRFAFGNAAQAPLGTFADGAMWSTVLSTSQIDALASGLRANHVAPQNMMVYWPITGTSPEPDRSGNNINGTVTGTTVVADPPQLEAWAQSYDPYTLSSGTILVLPAQEW